MLINFFFVNNDEFFCVFFLLPNLLFDILHRWRVLRLTGGRKLLYLPISASTRNSSIQSLLVGRFLKNVWVYDRSDCSTLSSFVESSSSSYLHLHELISLSLFGASGPEVVLKYIALGFPSFRQQQSLRTSYSQVSAKTNEVKRMQHLIKTTTSF